MGRSWGGRQPLEGGRDINRGVRGRLPLLHPHCRPLPHCLPHTHHPPLPPSPRPCLTMGEKSELSVPNRPPLLPPSTDCRGGGGGGGKRRRGEKEGLGLGKGLQDEPLTATSTCRR